MKISDFGLSREGDHYQMTCTSRLPIKWLSPETLNTGLYTQKSDVFSFGVLVWEVFSNGGEPYKGMGNAEMLVSASIGFPVTGLKLLEVRARRPAHGDAGGHARRRRGTNREALLGRERGHSMEHGAGRALLVLYFGIRGLPPDIHCRAFQVARQLEKITGLAAPDKPKGADDVTRETRDATQEEASRTQEDKKDKKKKDKKSSRKGKGSTRKKQRPDALTPKSPVRNK